jgi:hypothetical protein
LREAASAEIVGEADRGACGWEVAGKAVVQTTILPPRPRFEIFTELPDFIFPSSQLIISFGYYRIRCIDSMTFKLNLLMRQHQGSNQLKSAEVSMNECGTWVATPMFSYGWILSYQMHKDYSSL